MAVHQYKRTELRKVLRKNGYHLVPDKGSGSHEVWEKDGVVKPFMFPMSLNPMLVRRELNEHNIKVG